MAYVRQKKNSYGPCYQLVESYRDGWKVRQRVIAHPGRYPTVEEYLAGTRGEIERLRDRAASERDKAESIKQGTPERMRRQAQDTEDVLAAMSNKTPREVRTPAINLDEWFSTPPRRGGSRSVDRITAPYRWSLERAGVYDRLADRLEERLAQNEQSLAGKTVRRRTH